MHLKVFSYFILTSFAVFSVGCSDSSTQTTQAPGNAAKNAATSAAGSSGTDLLRSFKITASSQTENYGPEGVFFSTPPGWHSAQPAKYPETLLVDFKVPQNLQSIGILQQEGQPARAPKALRIEVSNDGTNWNAIAGSDDACKPNLPDGWWDIRLPKSATTRYMKLIVFSNCGDTRLLTIRGLRINN